LSVGSAREQQGGLRSVKERDRAGRNLLDVSKSW
jgi:hypothetical protein